jgi:hypothetical protein
MAYRRSSGTDVESSRWRMAHRNLLLECGVPQSVVNSDRRWVYVLLHGSDEFDTGWDPTWMSPQHASRLLQVLRAATPNTVGYDLIQGLQARATETNR